MTKIAQLSTSTDWPVGALPLPWVERLFERILLTYGKKFADQWGMVSLDKMKRHWASELGQMADKELIRGVDALEGLDWPPSLPEFKRLCRPSIDPLVAYYEAVGGMQEREAGHVGDWSHPAIYWAAVKVGAFDLKNQGYSAMKVRWDRAFADEMAKGQWPEIPKSMVALPAPGKTQLDRDQADKRVKELKASEVIKSAASKTDHKAWAKKILERQKKGDKTLTMIQIRFTKEAMGAPA
jgi:hypothetical protein